MQLTILRLKEQLDTEQRKRRAIEFDIAKEIIEIDEEIKHVESNGYHGSINEEVNKLRKCRHRAELRIEILRG